MSRQRLLTAVAESILGLALRRIVRVGVDGVDGAGKTTFADELARALEQRGQRVIRASVDGFHNPRAIRYRLGRASPEGFFRDSYDYGRLRSSLLDPLSPGGTRRYHVAAFDHRSDTAIATAVEVAAPDSILVFDGIFLHCPELRRYWDYSVFLEVGFDVSIPRCAQGGYGSADPHAPDNHRYVEGQKIYLGTCAPRRHATVTIKNEDLAAPYVVGGG